MRKYKNSIGLGIVIALTVPVLAFLIIFIVTRDNLTAADYLQKALRTGVLTRFISISVFFNIAPFLIFNRIDWLNSSKGVLGTTFVWAFIVFILYLI